LERGVIVYALAAIGASVVCLWLLSVAWYCADLWRASRRDRRKWDALARQEQREAVERALGDESTPGETVIRWD
jgi:hypothetical protein